MPAITSCFDQQTHNLPLYCFERASLVIPPQQKPTRNLQSLCTLLHSGSDDLVLLHWYVLTAVCVMLFRPLVLGKRTSDQGDEWCVASEDCAFGPIGFQRVRDVLPGEMIVIDEEGEASYFAPSTLLFSLHLHASSVLPDNSPFPANQTPFRYTVCQGLNSSSIQL